MKKPLKEKSLTEKLQPLLHRTMIKGLRIKYPQKSWNINLGESPKTPKNLSQKTLSWFDEKRTHNGTRYSVFWKIKNQSSYLLVNAILDSTNINGLLQNFLYFEK